MGPAGSRMSVLRLVLKGLTKPSLQRAGKPFLTNCLCLVYLGAQKPCSSWRVLLILQGASASPPGHSSLDFFCWHG